MEEGLEVWRVRVTRGVEVKRVRSLGRGMKGWVGEGGVGSMTQLRDMVGGGELCRWGS